MTLNDVTSMLGSQYRAWKAAEKRKDELKKDFFESVESTLSLETPAQTYEEIFASDDSLAAEKAEKKFPTFRVLSTLEAGEGVYRVVLEERIEFRPFVHINKDDGYVYQRQVTNGSPILDDDRLKAEDPDLWERISILPVPERELKPWNQIDPEDIAKLSEYLYSGKPQVKLAAPRKAKPEELDEDYE